MPPFYNIAADCLSGPENRRALIFEGDEDINVWSFGDLKEASSRVAFALKKKGLKRGDRVILHLPNGPEFPSAFFGAIGAGLIPIPASRLLTERELSFIKKDSGARMVLKDPSRVKNMMRQAAFAVSFPKTRSDDSAFWLYTSGTSGKPKAVIHAHRSIPAHDARCRVWMDLKEQDLVFNTSGLNWSYALTGALADVLRQRAASVIDSGKPEPERLLQIIDRHGVTIFMSVPGIYRRLVEYLSAHPKEARKLRTVRVCLSAGEKLPSEIRRRFNRLAGLTIREGLGMTEHSVYLAQPKGRCVVEGSCGKALPGHRIAILSEDLRPAKRGEVGSLASHRSCPGLMLGYYRRPDEQKAVFQGDWFLSGDLAYRDAKGNYFYVGRRDDVITAGGYRISPMEVEAILNRHPAVLESAVVGIERGAGKTLVCGYVVLRKGWKVSQTLRSKIIAATRTQLASYKVPRDIVFVSSLPKTSNGKLIRRKFRSL